MKSGRERKHNKSNKDFVICITHSLNSQVGVLQLNTIHNCYISLICKNGALGETMTSILL